MIFFEICKLLRKFLRKLWILRQLGREGGDDEATEGAIELVGRCAEELSVGASDVLVSGFAVLDVTILPIGETLRVGHLYFTLFDSLRESADSTLATLSKWSSIRVGDSVSVRAAVASTHDDMLFAREFATEMVKRKGWLYFSHSRVAILRVN